MDTFFSGVNRLFPLTTIVVLGGSVLGLGHAHADSACEVSVWQYHTRTNVGYVGKWGGTQANQEVTVNLTRIARVENTGLQAVRLHLYSANPPIGAYAVGVQNGRWSILLAAGAKNPLLGNEPYDNNIKIEKITCSGNIDPVSALVTPVLSNPALLKRRLRNSETDIAMRVFGNSVDYRKVRVTNHIGGGNRAWAYNNLLEGTQEINVGPTQYNNAFDNSVPSNPLVHEMVHVWQYQRAVPVELNSIMSGQVYPYSIGASGGSYRPWQQFNVEQQGKLVQDWFDNGESTTHRLYPYIRDCIRPGRVNCTPTGRVP